MLLEHHCEENFPNEGQKGIFKQDITDAKVKYKILTKQTIQSVETIIWHLSFRKMIYKSY